MSLSQAHSISDEKYNFISIRNLESIITTAIPPTENPSIGCVGMAVLKIDSRFLILTALFFYPR